jgi:hypothetical protein
MTGPPTLADLMADPRELVVTCLDCHHSTTIPVAALLSRYAAETPFPDVRPARWQDRSPRHSR